MFLSSRLAIYFFVDCVKDFAFVESGVGFSKVIVWIHNEISLVGFQCTSICCCFGSCEYLGEKDHLFSVSII